MHDNGKWLEERTFSKADVVWELMAPFRWMGKVSLYCSVVRINASELNVFAKIVSAIVAKKTLTARDARFDGYAVAWICFSNVYACEYRKDPYRS